MRLHLAGMTIALVLSMGFCVASAKDAYRLAQASAPDTAAAEQKLLGVAAWGQLVGNSITGKENGETLVGVLRVRWNGQIDAWQRNLHR